MSEQGGEKLLSGGARAGGNRGERRRQSGSSGQERGQIGEDREERTCERVETREE